MPTTVIPAKYIEIGPMHPDLFDGETPILWVTENTDQKATKPRDVRGGGSTMPASVNDARRP